MILYQPVKILIQPFYALIRQLERSYIGVSMCGNKQVKPITKGVLNVKDQWTKEVTTYESLLVLKTDHLVMGKKGQVFFVPYTPISVSTGQVVYMIADPIYVEGTVCSGGKRFAVTEMELLTFFQLEETDVETYLKRREQLKEDRKEDGANIDWGFSYE